MAQAITLLFLIFDVFRVKLIKLSSLDLKLGKELIVFSIPLMSTGIAGFIMTWTDTFNARLLQNF